MVQDTVEIEQDAGRMQRMAVMAYRKRIRLLWWVLSLVGILLFAAGFGVARLLQPGMPGAQSPEVDFAHAMNAHHEQAVEMALIIRERSKDETLRLVALDIILTQRTQIGQMQGWLNVWQQPLADPRGHQHMQGMATRQEVNALKTLPLAEAEKQFLRLMIRHHEGGIVMAQQALQEAKRPEVLRLARAIVNSQKNEIDALNNLLAAK